VCAKAKYSRNRASSAALRDAQAQPVITNRRLLPVKIAAQRLGLSTWGMREMAYSGRCASHKVCNRLMIAEDEVDRIIASSERPRLVSA
jgi:hypothetical protein